ncbi:hypothetical protein [Lacticaseibacillus camelliae]|uniref:Lipoprotein n=1 Tax=Lacticaseibacillus camelliae DSM 22697 = JCM 13995 TaxID=1423730 RepID=A0A0R2FEH9_9LACO|nr:hypothetical protein [Lacticaseibacillus camelliae]KRN22996.1 hypothetical protein FC75_GL001635 [Lacticaseibacillus camelliae DSM 22697 = JCM 13995]
MKLLNKVLPALAVLLAAGMLGGCNQTGSSQPGSDNAKASSKNLPGPKITAPTTLFKSVNGKTKLKFKLSNNAKFTLRDRDANNKVLVSGEGSGKTTTINGAIDEGELDLVATLNGKTATKTLSVVPSTGPASRVLEVNKLGLGPNDTYGLRVTQVTHQLNAEGQKLVASGKLRKNLSIQITVEYANFTDQAGFAPTPSQFEITGPFLAPATVLPNQQGTTKLLPGGYASTTFWAYFGNAGVVVGKGIDVQLDYHGPNMSDPLLFAATTE